jgi:PE-PPE domain
MSQRFVSTNNIDVSICRVRELGLSALASVSVLGLTLMTSAGVAHGADTALIIGPSEVPVPPQSYIDAADQLYLVPQGFGAYTPQGLTTPEQLWPDSGPNSLTIDNSVAQGVTILNGAINQQIAAGNKVVVFGYSQGSVVASQELAQLESSSDPPSPSQLSFVLVGEPSNPNGGFNQRFVGASLLGQTFDDAPAVSNTYPATVYTQEYDGFADFPQYPLDFLSDLNADVGMFTQHFAYADLTPQQISSAIPLPTTGGATQYFMVPATGLPLLAPVRLIPLIGDPLADLLQPDLTVLVNLGYGSITNGWSAGPANVATPLGVLPTNINVSDVVTALVSGAAQGVTKALSDLKSPQLFDTSGLSGLLAGLNTLGLTPSANPSLLQLVGAFAAFGNAGVPVSVTGVGSVITGAASGVLGIGEGLAATVQAIAVNLPQYDARLFSSQLQAGHLLNAIAMPIAADLALAPYALIYGAAFPVITAGATIVTQLAELAGLEPNPAASVSIAQRTPAAGAGSGPVAIAGSILRTDATIAKVGRGYNINGIEVGGAAALYTETTTAKPAATAGGKQLHAAAANHHKK